MTSAGRARAAAVAEADAAHEDAAAAAASRAASSRKTAPRAEAPGTRSRGGAIRRGGGRIGRRLGGRRLGLLFAGWPGERGTLTAQTEPIHVVAARKSRLEQRRALLDEHYPWDEDKGAARRRDGPELRACTCAWSKLVHCPRCAVIGARDPHVEVAVDGASPKKTGTVYDSLYPTWARSGSNCYA